MLLASLAPCAAAGRGQLGSRRTDGARCVCRPFGAHLAPLGRGPRPHGRGY